MEDYNVSIGDILEDQQGQQYKVVVRGHFYSTIKDPRGEEIVFNNAKLDSQFNRIGENYESKNYKNQYELQSYNF